MGENGQGNGFVESVTLTLASSELDKRISSLNTSMQRDLYTQGCHHSMTYTVLLKCLFVSHSHLWSTFLFHFHPSKCYLSLGIQINCPSSFCPLARECPVFCSSLHQTFVSLLWSVSGGLSSLEFTINFLKQRPSFGPSVCVLPQVWWWA